MKEYSVYFKGRPFDLNILISNLKFKDMLSLQQGIVLENYVSGLHGRSWVFASSNEIGIQSSVGNGRKRSAVNLVNTITILMNAKDTKHSMASANTTFLSLHCVGDVISVVYTGQHEENSVGLDSSIGELDKVISERIHENISITGGRYRLLNEYDDSALDEMDDEILHNLDRFDVLVLHEKNHEAVDNAVIFSCEGVMTGRVYVGFEAFIAPMQDNATNPHMVLHRLLREIDPSNLHDMDSMTLDQLNYIEIG